MLCCVDLEMGCRSSLAMDHRPALVQLPAVGDSPLLRSLLDEELVGVTESAVDVACGVGGAFALPWRNSGTNSGYHCSCRHWAIPALAVKLTDQGEMHRLAPFCIRVTPSLSPLHGWP